LNNVDIGSRPIFEALFKYIKSLEIKDKEWEVKFDEQEVKDKERDVKFKELEVKDKEKDVKITNLSNRVESLENYVNAGLMRETIDKIISSLTYMYYYNKKSCRDNLNKRVANIPECINYLWQVKFTLNEIIHCDFKDTYSIEAFMSCLESYAKEKFGTVETAPLKGIKSLFSLLNYNNDEYAFNTKRDYLKKLFFEINPEFPKNKFYY
jgi:hypothetical protein